MQDPSQLVRGMMSSSSPMSSPDLDHMHLHIQSPRGTNWIQEEVHTLVVLWGKDFLRQFPQGGLSNAHFYEAHAAGMCAWGHSQSAQQ